MKQVQEVKSNNDEDSSFTMKRSSCCPSTSPFTVLSISFIAIVCAVWISSSDPSSSTTKTNKIKPSKYVSVERNLQGGPNADLARLKVDQRNPIASMISKLYWKYSFHDSGPDIFAMLQTFNEVTGNADSCTLATNEISEITHEYATDGLQVSRIAFSSCYVPELVLKGKVWEHMRLEYQPDLWLWLGDNAYSDGYDMNFRRSRYNKAREHHHYQKFGPVAEPKIPVMGTWDDHDFGRGDAGNNYICRKESQDEFAFHFNLSEEDPRHPAQGENQQQGVYGANMFHKPSSSQKKEENGVHVIMLDVRYHRSPTVVGMAEDAPCEYENSTYLGDTQWSWLEQEFQKTSEIKVVGSGVSVLLPMDENAQHEGFCAYDGEGGKFQQAIEDMEEHTPGWIGGDTENQEGWFQMPSERSRLLRMAQKAINDGKAKKILFVSGDLHYNEINAKRMSEHPIYGPSQVLYEVSASRVEGRDGRMEQLNSNRLRIRTSDTRGNSFFNQECRFPFRYKGVTYNECTDFESHNGEPWCATRVLWPFELAIPTKWGVCKSKEEEIISTENITTDTTEITSCSGNLFHICKSGSFYGGIEVDWENRQIRLSAFTPIFKKKTSASAIIQF